MDEILKFILNNCSFLYNDYGFRFTNSSVARSFGNAMVIMSGDHITLRFCLERGRLHLDFRGNACTISGDSEWFSIEVIRQFVTGETVTHGVLDAENADFLKRNISSVIEAFDIRRIDETKNALNGLENSRAKRLFG